jgi:cell division transport system permease protein
MAASDLNLDSDASGRFLPWVVAVMVFLATMALVGTLAIEQATRHWRQGVEGRLTVQVAAIEGQPMAARLERALALVRATPGVTAAAALDRAAVEALLAPWLGAENLTADLPLPNLIDVRLAADSAIDIAALNKRLAAVPGARADDPRPWLERVERLAAMLRALGFAVVGLIALATVAMVVFATRAGLAAHRDAIEVLHTIGASDGYIARCFQGHVLGLAAVGALPGVAAALAVLYVIGAGAMRIEAALAPTVAFGAAEWAFVAALPAATVVLAMLTAYLTVLGHLRRMM